MPIAELIYRICKWGGIAFIIAAMATLFIEDTWSDPEPTVQADPAVASEIPMSGVLTWTTDGWLKQWQPDEGSQGGNQGEFVAADAPASLSRGKSKRHICRLTLAGATLPGSYEYRVVSKNHTCDQGAIIFWAHYDPKTSTVIWFDARTGLTLRHSDGGGLEGQTFCPAASPNDTWNKVDSTDPDGGPYFDQLGCVTNANQRLGVDAPLGYEGAKRFIDQFTSELLPLVAEPDCPSRFVVGCS